MDEDLKRSGSGNDSGPSSSDEEVDEVLDDNEKIHITFETIKKNINENKIDLSNSQGLKRFKDTYKDSLGKLTSETHYKHTLLHVLVESAIDKHFDKYRPLVKLIIEEHPDILKEPDASGRTSLYNAISTKRNKLVEFICNTHKDINSVLEQRCTGREETCIHAAIHKGMSAKFTIGLIKKASKRVLCIQDSQGNTPLHSAVEYGRCNEEQLQIVQTLAERGESEAMNKRTKETCLSPYLYHIHSRPKAINTAKEAANNIAKEKMKELTQGKRLNSNLASLDGAIRKDGEGGSTKAIQWGDLKGSAPSVASSVQRKHVSGETSNKDSLIRRPSLTPQMQSMSHEKPGVSYSKSESAETAVRSPLGLGECPNDSIDKDLKIVNGQVTELKKSTAPEKRKKKEKGKVTDASANAVEEFLMLHCMRTLSTKEAEDFLYGKTQGKEICFDLSNQSSFNITEDQIDQGFGPLEFERFLKYVDFPMLQIEKRSVRSHTKKSDSKGRDDMAVLFKFLRRKNVERIIHVIVADKGKIPHSDEAIELALGSFKVEIWEWQKFDICSETIASAAPDVEQAHLYWSGNNAVLWGWSEAETLKRMKKLKKGLETAERRERNINSFASRMKSLEIDVEPTDEEPPQKHESNNADTKAELERRHQWLTCMDGFADFIQAFKPSGPLYEPITIALIDDGVDMKEKTLYNRILKGKSFCLSDEITKRERPFYESGGHGTAMASLICRVCPNAKIIPLRLEEYAGNEKSKRQITAKSAAEAIRYAVERKADIISMSWTIKKTTENATHIEDLEEAVKIAATNGILMFCAASDGGAVTDLTFPAESRRDSVFKIGAATEEGKAWKWVGEGNNIDFIFPGLKVVQERYHQEALLQKRNLLTGSSVATALAAGLAALVLDCVKLAALHYTSLLKKREKLNLLHPPQKESSEAMQHLRSPEEETSLQQAKIEVDQDIERAERVRHDDYVNLKATKEMKAAFYRIGVTNEKYIKVWDLFEDAPKKAVGKTLEERAETIVCKIAKKLKE